MSFLLSAFAGCATPQGEIFTLASGAQWPPAPDRARLRFIGQFSRADDLKPARSGLEALGAAIAGAAPTPRLSRPTGVAVTADDKLLVTDPSLACLHVFDLRSRQYSRIGQAGGRAFVTPADVCAAGARIYVTDTAQQCVFVLDSAGQSITSFGSGALQRPVGIAAWTEPAGALGSAAVAAGDHAGIQSPAGARAPSETGDPHGPEAHATRTYFAHGPEARATRLYVIDAGLHACVMFEPDGREVGRFGRRGGGDGEFNFPTDVAAHPTTGIVVADTLNFRVQRFDRDGRFIAAFGRRGDGGGDFALPKGIAVDRAGRIYVVDAQFENVQVFDAAGQLLLAVGGEGSAAGQFWLPNQAAIDGLDRLWIADSYNRRVQAFQIVGDGAP